MKRRNEVKWALVALGWGFTVVGYFAPIECLFVGFSYGVSISCNLAAIVIAAFVPNIEECDPWFF